MKKLTGGNLSPSSNVMQNTYKQVKYQISSSINEGILEFILTGEIVESEINVMLKECNATILASGVNYILMDVRAIKGRFGLVWSL